MKCPTCGTSIPNAVDVRSIGSKGGKVKSRLKARTREQAQAAIRARWAKHKAKPVD